MLTTDCKAVKPNLHPLVEAKIKPILLQLTNKFFPVLVHSDPNRENAIFTPNREWILIDWDNAYAGSWLEDYTDLTYWADWGRKPSHAKRMRTLINKNFFKGYGASNFTQEQIIKVEKVLHIIKAINMLVYYYYFKKNHPEFTKTQKKLLKLLK